MLDEINIEVCSESNLENLLKFVHDFVRYNPGRLCFRFSNLPGNISGSKIEKILAYGAEKLVTHWSFELNSGRSLNQDTLGHILEFMSAYQPACDLPMTLSLSGNKNSGLAEKNGHALTHFFRESKGEWHLDLSNCGLEHFSEELTESIKANRTVISLNLDGNNLGASDDFSQGLIDALFHEDSALVELNLGKNDLSDQEIISVTHALARSRTLKDFAFEFSHNRTNRLDTLSRMVRAIQCNQSLETISLAAARRFGKPCYSYPVMLFPDFPDASSKWFTNPRILSLTLRWFILDVETVNFLLLVNFPNLTSLSLEGCTFAPGAFQRLSEILCENFPDLASLSLSRFPFPDDTLQMFANMLERLSLARLAVVGCAPDRVTDPVKYSNFVNLLSASRSLCDIFTFQDLKAEDNWEIKRVVEANKNRMKEPQRLTLFGWVQGICMQKRLWGFERNILPEILAHADCERAGNRPGVGR